MKIKVLEKNLNSTLSCKSKCLEFFNMFYKKIIFVFVLLVFLGACTAPTAMLGPAYTLTSTGNVFQAGISYGSSELVTMYTGKTPIENVIEIASTDKNNIQKKNFRK